MADITFDDAGNLYLLQQHGEVLRIDVGTGVVNMGAGLAWHNGTLIALTKLVPNTGQLGWYEINPSNGVSTFLSSYVGGQFPADLDSWNGVLYLARDGGTSTQYYTVNPYSGAMNLIGNGTGAGNRTLAVYDDSVPEPSTLMMVGLAGLVLCSRPRRAKRP
ncbi:MAG: PEP-CTERM sorting domain-containing protein [Acidobacteria bacterium]|nr:PEP-CTERM sorting domain-containing protein [Acidobacteriota bacterium]